MKERINRNHSTNSMGESEKEDLEYQLDEKNNSLFFDTCFIDSSERQIACIHGNCLKETSCFKNSLIQKKIDFHELQFHTEDRIIWCNEAVPDIISFMDSESLSDIQDYRFLFNQRYIRKDGSIAQFMHEGSLAISDKGNPVLKLTVFFEIGDIVTDDRIILKIFRYSAEHGFQKVFRKEYGETSNCPLSEREIEIIRLCHEGFSSKMIADKINLSIHTVKNHKRNSMAKTFTHNISELIRLCINRHWM